MSLDFSKTPDIIKLGITDPTTGWEKYFAEGVPFKDTALVLTGPLILLNALLVAAFGGLVPGMSFMGAFFSTLVGAVIGVFVGAGVFSVLAGVLGGTSNFDKAFSALSLAWVPALLGSIVAAIVPFVGFLVAIAAFVLSLVYLYRLLPLALAVPDGKRVWHFILGLVIVIVINAIIGSVLGLNRPSGDALSAGGSGAAFEGGEEAPRQSGMLGAMQRHGEIMEKAGTHRYDPPANGRVSKAQVEAYMAVQRKARKAQERFRQKMEDMEKQSADGENPGLAGLSSLGATISGAVTAGNAEMEIVVTGGGNWAEHNWVKGQLQTAMIHGGEGADPIPQNYKLFEPYLEELGQ